VPIRIVIAFMQGTQAAAINRANEPASAGSFDGSLTAAIRRR
jgi:hypothetical protein